MIERHWVIDLSETQPGRWFVTGLGVLGAIGIAKWAPEMLPVVLLAVPIGWLLHQDQSDRKPLWRFRKDRA